MKKHEPCKFQEYFDDGEGFYNGWWCNNPRCKDIFDGECPHFPEETYTCNYYEKGEWYED